MKRKAILPAWGLIFLWPVLTQADITFDGTMPGGAAAGFKIGGAPDSNIVNNQMEVKASYGHQSGSNLFHSFSRFNIDTGQSATFTNTGATGGAVNNVIGRVTGGSDSTIDGALNSTIPGANLYLVNPNGILFGQNASIDVDGAFLASTAEYVSFGNNEKFHADLNQASVLSSAAPQAFGFLDAPADLVLSGSQILLADNRSAHFSGGNLLAVDTGVYTTGGNIELVAAGNGGVEIVPGHLMDATGTLTARNSDFLALSSAQSSGAIHLAGGDVSLVEGTNTTGNSLANGLFSNPTRAGDIVVEADRLTLDNSRVTSNTNNASDGGWILITANDITVRNSGVVSATTSGSGQGGEILIGSDPGDTIPDRIVVDHAEITADATGSGRPGTIGVQTGDLLLDDGRITALNRGSYRDPEGGFRSIGIMAQNSVTVQGGNAGIASASLEGTGEAGGTRVTTDALRVLDGGVIASSTLTGGKAGNIVVEAEHLLVAGEGVGDQGRPHSSAITASTLAAGGAGNVEIGGRNGLRAKDVTIRDGGRIASSTAGGGNGGNVDIDADLLTLDNQASIRALSDTGAPAGTVTIRGVQADILNGSEITVASQSGDAGDISMFLSRWLYLLDSRITTSAARGLGNGGNIFIDPLFVILNNSQIIANALAGSGGNIDIITEFFLASTNSIVSASSQFGLQGTVSIQSAQSNIAGSISVLPGVFMDVSGLIREGCGSRNGQGGSTFTSSSLQGLVRSSPDNALDYMPVSLAGCSTGL